MVPLYEDLNQYYRAEDERGECRFGLATWDDEIVFSYR